MKATAVPVDQIIFDESAQSRAATDMNVVDDYAQLWKQKVKFPPVELWFDGEAYYIGDGIHRTMGAKRAGRTTILAHVHEGTKEDALRAACAANQSHGLRRTNADKRRCVSIMLRLDAEWSDSRVAAHVGVTDKLVAIVRKSLEAGSEIPNLDTRIGKDGKRYAAPRQAEESPEEDGLEGFFEEDEETLDDFLSNEEEGEEPGDEEADPNDVFAEAAAESTPGTTRRNGAAVLSAPERKAATALVSKFEKIIARKPKPFYARFEPHLNALLVEIDRV